MSYKYFSFGLLGIAFGAFTMGALQFTFAWTAPGGTPPNNNVAAPINVSADAQTKSGPLRLTGGGGYNAGMLTVGDVSLNDHPSNQWLYVGDVNGSIYGGKGLAANNLYSASYMYADLMYDTSNSGYYINPDSISNVNKMRSISTTAGDTGTTLVTKDYLDAKVAASSGPVRTWQNFTGSRGNKTWYTNNTDHDIEVSARAYSGARGTWCTITIGVNYIPADYNFVNNSRGAAMCNGSATVPAGAVYQVDAGPELHAWFELR